MSTELTLWKEQLLAELSGATWEFIEMKLRSVISEFYTRSGSWIDMLPPINLKAGRTTYKLNPQPNTIVLYVISADVDGNMKYPRHRNASGTNSFTVLDNGELTLDEAPAADVTRGLTVTVMLKPLTGCEEFPDSLGNVWYETIRYGVLGNMQAMVNRPWTDKGESVINRKLFRRGIAEARDIARKGYALIDAPVAFPPWAR